jgi:hypothetical protein
MFLVRPGAYLRRGSQKVSHSGRLRHNLQTRLNRPVLDKHSSSFGTFISHEIFYECKSYFVLNTVLGRINVDLTVTNRTFRIFRSFQLFTAYRYHRQVPCCTTLHGLAISLTSCIGPTKK